LPGAKHETGLQHISELELICAKLLQRLFGHQHAEVRALSGSQAVQMALMTTVRPGDSIFSLPATAGGHASHLGMGFAGLFGLKIHEVPFNQASLAIDMSALHVAVQRIKPKALLIGSSMPLFPFPIKELRSLADDVGATLIYDAAHVTGMIAGDQFQTRDELRHAHMVTSSSYKSFGGSSGGFVLTDSGSLAEKLACIAFPGLTANTDTSRFPGLAIAAADLLSFGPAYADQCVRNAQALAFALHSQGCCVLRRVEDMFEGDVMSSQVRPQSFTCSHMIAADVNSLGGGMQVAQKLEDAHILASPIGLPVGGLRLGVQELTKHGMREQQMEGIAGLICDVLFERRPVAEVKASVAQLRSEFTSYHFMHQ